MYKVFLGFLLLLSGFGNEAGKESFNMSSLMETIKDM